jgi:PAS domain S-box-containing protein
MGRDNEYRVRSKDGSTRWVLSRGMVLRDPQGKPVRFIGTSTDITERQQAEEALRASEERSATPECANVWSLSSA